MTYEELLELIAANEEFYDDGTNRTPSWSALRAIVELHKPNEFSECINCKDEWGYNDVRNESYPCPTIQAIEGQLL